MLKPELQGYVKVLGSDVKRRKRFMLINLRHGQLEQYTTHAMKELILEIPFKIIVKCSMHKTIKTQFRVVYKADIEGYGEPLELQSKDAAEVWVREINKALADSAAKQEEDEKKKAPPPAAAAAADGDEGEEQQRVVIMLPKGVSVSPRATYDVTVEDDAPPPAPPRDDE